MDRYEKYIGAVFDNRYRIEQIIGIGGMAVVYKATDMLINRTVAVKILKDDISKDEASVKRFINESRAVAMLSHKNIVNIYDVSMHDNIKYIVMEYIEGITLKNYMTKKGALSFSEVVNFTEQILCALCHAHSKGIVHRDIKPQNIMLLKNGVIKVMDFGIAKLPNSETVTMSDKAIGTVYYISPEQASSGKIDARSDIYSLGVLMYEMATGVLPFDGDTAVTVALKQINDKAIPPREINPNIPQGLEQIIMSAMEKSPENRYQNASDMLAHVRSLKENPYIIFRQTAKTKKETQKTKKQKTDSHSLFPIITGVAFAFLIVVSISAYFILSTFFSSQKQNAELTKTIEVDNFVGYFYTTELNNYFVNSDEYSVVLKYEYNPTYENGRIIEQDPKAGSKKKITYGESKCEITLTISRGAETVVLPNYTATEYRSAKLAIEALGLVCKIENIYSSSFESGYVIRTSPEAGTKMNIDDTVIIYVSKGAEAGKIIVPDYVGNDEVTVLRSLIELGLTPGNITYVKDNEKAGNILKQSIDPGKTVNKFTSIDFIVSGGPKYGEYVEPDPTTSEPTSPVTSDISGTETTEPTAPITSEPTAPDGSETVTEDVTENTTDIMNRTDEWWHQYEPGN